MKYGRLPYNRIFILLPYIEYLFIPIWHSLIMVNKYNVNICRELYSDSDMSDMSWLSLTEELSIIFICVRTTTFKIRGDIKFIIYII